MLRLMRDLVLIKELPEEEKTESGIILRPTKKIAVNKGRVLNVGKGVGGVKMQVKKGDTVYYEPHSGAPMALEGQEVVIMKENDIMLVVEEPKDL